MRTVAFACLVAGFCVASAIDDRPQLNVDGNITPDKLENQQMIPGKISALQEPELVPMKINSNGDEEAVEPINYVDWKVQDGKEAEVPGTDGATKPLSAVSSTSDPNAREPTSPSKIRDMDENKTTLQENASGVGPCCNICPQIAGADCEKESCYQTCYQLCGPFCQYTDTDEHSRCQLGIDCNMLPKQLNLDAVNDEEPARPMRGSRGNYISFKPFVSQEEEEENPDGMETITQFTDIAP